MATTLYVYADETGTNDPTGQQPGSATPAFCGYIETPEYWKAFSRNWKRILNNYRAPYFHFREFANKKLRAETQSPYYNWSEDKRDGFLYELALLASETAVPIGGYSNAKLYHQINWEGDVYEIAIQQFFRDFYAALNSHWPNFGGKLFFVFDSCRDEKLLAPIRKSYEYLQKQDVRFGGLFFQDDKLHPPLQAADLYAYAFRQYVEKRTANPDVVPKMRLLDVILNKNLDVTRKMGIGTPGWHYVVNLVREHQKRQKAEWAKQGDPKKQYYPEEHFPFHEYRNSFRKRSLPE